MGYQEYRDQQEFLDNPYSIHPKQKVFGPGFGHKLVCINQANQKIENNSALTDIRELAEFTRLGLSIESQEITTNIQQLIQQIIRIINNNELVLPVCTNDSFASTIILANSLVNHIAHKAPEKTLTMIHSSYWQLSDLQEYGAHLLTNTGNVFAGNTVVENLRYLWNYAMMQPTTTIKSNTDNRNNFYRQAISKLQRDLTFQTQINNKPITIAHINTFDDFTQFRKHMKCISLALAISYNQANPDTQNHIIANSMQFQEFIDRFLYIHNIDPKSQAIFYDQDGRDKYNQLV